MSFTDPADVQKQITEAFGLEEPQPLTPDPLEEVPPSSPEPAEEPPAPVEPPAEEPAAGSLVTLPDGSQISQERLNELAFLDRSFRQNPQIAERVTEAVRAAAPSLGNIPDQLPVPEPQKPAEAPPELDLDDPALKYLWNELQSTKSQITSYQQAEAQRQAQAAALAVNAGKAEVAKKHNLNPDEITALDMRAASMIDLHRLAHSRGGDYKAATVEALELAALADPDYRTKFIPTPTPDTARQKNLTALAGGSGATPRSEPDPSTLSPEQRKAAMINELAQSLKGQST